MYLMLFVYHSFFLGIIRKLLEQTENYDLILSRAEIQLLEGFSKILEIFNVFSTFIQAQQYTTMNMLALFHSEIMDSLRNMEIFVLDSVLLDAIEILKKNLKKRFPITNEIIASAMLDPRMHGLPIINEHLSANGEVQLLKQSQSNTSRFYRIICIVVS